MTGRSDRGALEVVRVAGLATVQDGGRPGRMHEGIPPGGALVPELLARANRAVGNAEEAAGIEVVGSMTVKAAGGAVTLATEDGGARVLDEGEALEVEARGTRRARYLAVKGGIDVPQVLGGRGTLIGAGIGGYEGRGLRRGDRVRVGDASGDGGGDASGDGGRDSPIRVVLGPDDGQFAPEALRALLGEPFRLSPASDRTGSRLVGPPLPRLAGLEPHDRPSTPMVAGAIEVPPSGAPIVLGPDHPTTGGYPVIAVVVRADLGRFHARPIGTEIRFTRAVSAATTRV